MLRDILNNALNYLKNYKHGIIVFDIDDTLLHPSLNDSIPIKETIQFYHTICRMGFTPYIVTAREDNPVNVKITVMELTHFGVDQYPYIYFRPSHITDLYEFKKRCRANIEEITNQKIIMSVGDKPWDMGEYGGYGVLVKA